MNISKALKTKNRLAGELARAKAIFARENSHRVGETPKTSLQALLDNVNRIQEELIQIKIKIALASAPALPKLVRMGEYKARMAWLTELPIREGIQRERFAAEKAEPEIWVAHLDTVKRDHEIDSLQKAINELQDEIDDFNATTQI